MPELSRLIKDTTSRLRSDDRGANLVEYGLLMTLIAVVVVPAVVVLAPLIADLYARALAAF
jgi:pilus assembly protein Flp/PilA